MIKKLLAILGLIELVWTEDYDGAVRLRVIRKHPITGRRAVIGIINIWASLEEDGSTSGCSYVKRWAPYRKAKS